MGWLWLILLSLVALVLLLFHSARRDAEYFRSKGIYYLWNGTYRIAFVVLRGFSIVDHIHELYSRMKKNNAKVAGTREFGLVGLVVKDPELIKHILIKDFDHFVDRREFAVPESDRLFGKMLIFKKGDTWKGLRSKLSPTFTTGKIKRMFQFIRKSGDHFVTFLEDEASRGENGEVELSDAYSKFTMDVIASTACGIDSKAFESREPSVFEEMGDKLRTQFKGLRMLKLLLILMVPKVANMLGMTFFGHDESEFFRSAVMSSIRHREAKGEKRDDFIQLMLEARANQLKTEESELGQFEKDAIVKPVDGSGGVNLDDESIVANSVLFIFAGSDTTQSLLLYVPYALALNIHVQDKLRDEVDRTFEECDGELTYDAVHKMEYLDMVINETLRVYPPAVMIDRGCVKDYKVPGTDFVLKKGQAVFIPILGLHHDEEFWPEPQKFFPERFSSENKGKINQHAFLPFGQGPRNCIGMRFALTEVKLAIANLVRNFRVEPSKKTPIPMKYLNTGSLKPAGGMWLGLQKRTL